MIYTSVFNNFDLVSFLITILLCTFVSLLFISGVAYAEIVCESQVWFGGSSMCPPAGRCVLWKITAPDEWIRTPRTFWWFTPKLSMAQPNSFRSVLSRSLHYMQSFRTVSFIVLLQQTEVTNTVNLKCVLSRTFKSNFLTVNQISLYVRIYL